MGWQRLSVGEICKQIKDPARNGGRVLEESYEHDTHGLVGWGWNPAEGRAPAPGSQEIFGQLTQGSVDTGAVGAEE